MEDRFSPNLTFEEALKQLEDIVRKLEAGDLPLSESIVQYKLSMQLVQFCRRALDKAELEVRELTDGGSEQEFRVPRNEGVE